MDANAISLWTTSASRGHGGCASNRAIRTLPQWLMAYVRMLVAMTTCGMMDMQFWLSHMYTVLKVATLDDKEGGLTEETRGYLAVMYDDCRRQAWADQTQQDPHTMDMRVEAGLISEHTMVQARVRLADVMQAIRVQKLAEMEHMGIVPVHTHNRGAHRRTGANCRDCRSRSSRRRSPGARRRRISSSKSARSGNRRSRRRPDNMSNNGHGQAN